MIIEIKDGNVNELFERLCDIPVETVDMWGGHRPAGIDDILDQLIDDNDVWDESWDESWDDDEFEKSLDSYINCKHEELKPFSDYIDNVDFNDWGMIYDKHELCICQQCGDTIDVTTENMQWYKHNRNTNDLEYIGI